MRWPSMSTTSRCSSFQSVESPTEGMRPSWSRIRPEMELQEDVFDVDETNDMVEIAFVDRQPREAGHRDGAHHFLDRRAGIQRVEVDPRPHHVAHGPLAEPQGLDGHFLFERLENSF